MMKFYLLIFILTENTLFCMQCASKIVNTLTLNWFRACNILVFMVHWTEENQFFYFLLLCFQTCILFLFEGIFKLNGIENLFWWLPSTIHCGSFNVIHHESVTESVKMTEIYFISIFEPPRVSGRKYFLQDLSNVNCSKQQAYMKTI